MDICSKFDGKSAQKSNFSKQSEFRKKSNGAIPYSRQKATPKRRFSPETVIL